MMEVSIFPKPELPIAGLLSRNFVEARLHSDGETNIERIKELQETLARSVANPIYVVVEPETERELARHEGAALNDAQVEAFAEFLRGSTVAKEASASSGGGI